MNDNKKSENRSLTRVILTEKYPHYILREILINKWRAASLQNYQEAAEWRDKEISFYKERLAYDIRHITRNNISKKSFLEILAELEAKHNV